MIGFANFAIAALASLGLGFAIYAIGDAISDGFNL